MAASAFVIAAAAIVWLLGGAAGLLYLVAFPMLCLPGFPLGFALFGRRHAAGWLAGLLLGYAATTVVWWAVVYLGHPSVPGLVAAWAAATGATWLAARSLRAPVVVLPAWTSGAAVALLCLLLLTSAIIVGPFARLGSADASGGRQYRAYFIADFVWHTALTAELAKQEPQPRNPFLASEPVHYYWTYFRVPATIVATTGMEVERALKLNAFITALLLVASIYLAAWAARPEWPGITGAAVALTILAASLEGWAGIADVVQRGLPLAELRDLNIDAIAAWAFKGLRIDNLPRTMWYTPQHGFSLALGLLAVPVALRAGAAARPSAIALAGCALGASVAFNPLLGGAFCVVYGATVAIDALRSPRLVATLLRHAIAVVPVAIALGWCTLNQVAEGAGSALHFGFWGLARNATVVTFLLQFGPLLVPIAIGLWPGPAGMYRTLWPALVGVVVATLVMHLMALTVDLAWVGFRGGNIFFALAPALAANGLARLWTRQSPRAAVGVAVLVLAAGLPTTVIDAYNAQDVENLNLSRDAERVRGTDVAFDRNQEFHWTVVVTAGQYEALTWIRLHTAPTAIVQAEPTIRGREIWSLIPSFAERRMATGNALPLLARPIYDEYNARVRQIYATTDAQAAWSDARALGIDYLYVDWEDRSAYPGAGKFDNSPEYFTTAFKNAEAAVYALRP